MSLRNFMLIQSPGIAFPRTVLTRLLPHQPPGPLGVGENGLYLYDTLSHKQPTTSEFHLDIGIQKNGFIVYTVVDHTEAFHANPLW